MKGNWYRIHCYTKQAHNLIRVLSPFSLQPSAHTGPSLTDFHILKMEAIRCSETSAHTRATRRHIPEDGILQPITMFILKSYLFWWPFVLYLTTKLNVYLHSSTDCDESGYAALIRLLACVSFTLIRSTLRSSKWSVPFRFCKHLISPMHAIVSSRVCRIHPHCLDLGTSWRWVVSFTPLPLTPGERVPGTHCIGSWVDPRGSLDNEEKRKFMPLPGLELRTLVVQPVASRYTDWATTAYTGSIIRHFSVRVSLARCFTCRNKLFWC
jgi:hypothetical protein